MRVALGCCYVRIALLLSMARCYHIYSDMCAHKHKCCSKDPYTPITTISASASASPHQLHFESLPVPPASATPITMSSASAPHSISIAFEPLPVPLAAAASTTIILASASPHQHHFGPPTCTSCNSCASLLKSARALEPSPSAAPGGAAAAGLA
eukprot:scaffold84631_cov22-Tisochrysis_lutea.AAC.1